MGKLKSWFKIVQTGNLPAGEKMDFISRWLLITRACVFPMTLISVLVGGLLVQAAGDFSWVCFLICAFGLILAHAANNMFNDYFDFKEGLDSHSYTRGQYAPHPILDGLLTPSRLLLAALLFTAADGLIALYLTWQRGWLVLFLALAGLFLSVFYTASPLRLKKLGLGELTVFLVWGPMMVGGTFFVTTGVLPSWVWLASLPYAFLVVTVLVGKHIDKLAADRSHQIYTLPVRLGEKRAKALNGALMIVFYLAVVALVITGILGVWTLLVFLSFPKFLKVLRAYRQPPPETAPPGFPIWPLWYVAWAMVFIRQAGLFFLLGLALQWIYPLSLSLF